MLNMLYWLKHSLLKKVMFSLSHGAAAESEKIVTYKLSISKKEVTKERRQKVCK